MTQQWIDEFNRQVHEARLITVDEQREAVLARLEEEREKEMLKCQAHTAERVKTIVAAITEIKETLKGFADKQSACLHRQAIDKAEARGRKEGAQTAMKIIVFTLKYVIPALGGAGAMAIMK